MKNNFISTGNGNIDSLQENLGSLKGRLPGLFFYNNPDTEL